MHDDQDPLGKFLGQFDVVFPKSEGVRPPRGAPDPAGVNRIYRAQIKRSRRAAKRLADLAREKDHAQP